VLLDRHPPSAADARQIVSGEASAQWLRAEFAEQGMFQRRCIAPVQAAEPPRIGEPQAAAIVEDEVHVIMLGRGSAGGRNGQAARHAQVQQQGAGVGFKQQILGAPRHSCDALPLEPGCQPPRYRPAQARFANLDGRDVALEHVGPDAAAGGFDFR
jgi:hypothetical protein